MVVSSNPRLTKLPLHCIFFGQTWGQQSSRCGRRCHSVFHMLSNVIGYLELITVLPVSVFLKLRNIIMDINNSKQTSLALELWNQLTIWHQYSNWECGKNTPAYEIRLLLKWNKKEKNSNIRKHKSVEYLEFHNGLEGILVYFYLFVDLKPSEFMGKHCGWV